MGFAQNPKLSEWDKLGSTKNNHLPSLATRSRVKLIQRQDKQVRINLCLRGERRKSRNPWILSLRVINSKPGWDSSARCLDLEVLLEIHQEIKRFERDIEERRERGDFKVISWVLVWKMVKGYIYRGPDRVLRIQDFYRLYRYRENAIPVQVSNESKTDNHWSRCTSTGKMLYRYKSGNIQNFANIHRIEPQSLPTPPNIILTSKLIFQLSTGLSIHNGTRTSVQPH